MSAPRRWRGVEIAPFYTSRIARRAATLRLAGREVIPMHFGQPTAGTPAVARAAAGAALAADPTGYFESRDLTARIARHYREHYGVEVAPERILLTAGASAALVAVFAALTEPGDRVALARPGYPAYRNALKALGRVPVEIDCPAGSGYRLSAAALGAAPGPLHAVVVASPANPTGAMLDRGALGALAAACRAHGAALISDEIYHGISYGARAVSALEVDADAILIGSFSKLHRMPGWRLGWLVVPAELAARLSAYVVNLFLTPPTLSQYAALAAIDAEADLAAAVADYRHNRDTLLAALAAAGITGIVPPDGAFYLYADVGHLTRDSLALCERLLDETGIAIAPGVDFDTVHGGRFVRLSFALKRAEVARAIELLIPWLKAQKSL
ncbi:MAG TPA: aminotransferase class I/II-fold pyridoxal phosphate-dependent enzyme [Steroidobacteraceae bacterium]|nr:aminotransferase class I/II-fold pyridoxal phosphate-dependent enzyme [Steroidobacteraceae bacterium]